jgi:hypothetical protein
VRAPARTLHLQSSSSPVCCAHGRWGWDVRAGRRHKATASDTVKRYLVGRLPPAAYRLPPELRTANCQAAACQWYGHPFSNVNPFARAGLNTPKMRSRTTSLRSARSLYYHDTEYRRRRAYATSHSVQRPVDAGPTSIGAGLSAFSSPESTPALRCCVTSSARLPDHCSGRCRWPYPAMPLLPSLPDRR